MIFELQTAIKNKLIATDKFVNVYEYHTLKKEGFPYCTFELSDFDGKFLDSCTNERTFRFSVVVLHIINDDYPRNDAVGILYRALEQVIEDFDRDMDLGEGLIVRGDVSSGEMGVVVEGDGQTMALNINVALTITTQAQQ